MMTAQWRNYPGNLEWSQNTVLLASTQAVYKAPHSTVRGVFLEISI